MTGRSCFFSLLSAALLGFIGYAYADNYAYMATGSAAFGVLDLNTGAFSKCGQMQAQVAGLGVGPDLALYGGAYESNTLYKVDLTNGSLTAVGTSDIINFFLIGSTTSGLFTGGTDGNLYSMDTIGNVTLIGLIGLSGHYWGMSANSKSLYLTVNQGGPSTLYKLNLKTGGAKAIGTASEGVFGAELMERGTLYAGSISPLAIYALSTTDGSSSLVSNLSGDGISGGPWGLAPIREQHIKKRKICEAHQLLAPR